MIKGALNKILLPNDIAIDNHVFPSYELFGHSFYLCNRWNILYFCIIFPFFSSHGVHRYVPSECIRINKTGRCTRASNSLWTCFNGATPTRPRVYLGLISTASWDSRTRLSSLQLHRKPPYVRRPLRLFVSLA